MRIVLALLFALPALAGCTTTDGCQMPPDPPEAGSALVVIETNMGCMTAKIFEDKVPITAGNFLALAERGDFDGTPFHRIIGNFMMQGGDTTNGDGTGGEAHPDFDADRDGQIPDEFDAELLHERPGRMSMANRGANTGSSQFFITFTATPWLDWLDEQGSPKNCAHPQVSCHPVFGQIVHGFDVLDEVERRAGTQSGTPNTPVTFVKATVIR